MKLLQHFEKERKELARRVLEIFDLQSQTRQTASRDPELLRRLKVLEADTRAWATAILETPIDDASKIGGAT